jgi:hypothetical protein
MPSNTVRVTREKRLDLTQTKHKAPDGEYECLVVEIKDSYKKIDVCRAFYGNAHFLQNIGPFILTMM